jgi:hypothetical protein
VPKPKSGEHDSGHHAPPASGGPEADYSQYWQSYSQYWSQMAAYNTPSYFDPASYYNSK